MKFLLVNPPQLNTIDFNVPKIDKDIILVLPPLGLMYIAAILKDNSGHQVEILDSQVDCPTYEQLEEKLKEKKPDIIGITALTFTLVDVFKTIDLAKRILPSAKIILGGPHVGIYPRETIENPGVDFLVLGEGEVVIKDLLDNIDKPEKLKNIKGIVFKSGGQVINTGVPDFIRDLDSLPFPARGLTSYKKYFSVLSSRMPATTMFTSRGCPYKCLFCDRPHLGKIFRARSAKNVVDEMEECQKMGIKEIFIYDDTFGVDRQRVLDICFEIKKRNLNIAWDIRTRVNTVDDEVLRLLKDAGCLRIHYGVEAGTQKILDVLKKGITLQQVEDAFRLTKKNGIETLTYFMIGSPQETKSDIEQTLKLMKKLKPDYTHISITTPFPATDLYALAVRENVIKDDVWRKFAKNPNSSFIPPIWDKEIPREELFALFKKAYRIFYFRPSYIVKNLLKLKSLKEFIIKAKTAWSLLRF